MTILDVVKWGFAAYVANDFIRYVRRGTIKRHFTIFIGRSWKEWLVSWLLAVGVLAVILLCVGTLLSLHNPVLSFSWIQLISTQKEAEHGGTNLIASTTTLPFLGIIFALLLAVNIPRLARLEEDAFRRGTVDWRDGAIRSVKFGFVHMFVGVPVAAALALSILGLWLTHQYFVGGVRQSTFYHALSNYTMLILLGIYMLTTL
jgi:hypothetical protein